jgi:hypothetical protein
MVAMRDWTEQISGMLPWRYRYKPAQGNAQIINYAHVLKYLGKHAVSITIEPPTRPG